MSQTIRATVAEAVFAKLQQLQPPTTNVNNSTTHTPSQPPTNVPTTTVQQQSTTNKSTQKYNNDQIQALIEKLDTNQGTSKHIFTSYNKNTDIFK